MLNTILLFVLSTYSCQILHSYNCDNRLKDIHAELSKLSLTNESDSAVLGLIKKSQAILNSPNYWSIKKESLRKATDLWMCNYLAATENPDIESPAIFITTNTLVNITSPDMIPEKMYRNKTEFEIIHRNHIYTTFVSERDFRIQSEKTNQARLSSMFTIPNETMLSSIKKELLVSESNTRNSNRANAKNTQLLLDLRERKKYYFKIVDVYNNISQEEIMHIRYTIEKKMGIQGFTATTNSSAADQVILYILLFEDVVIDSTVKSSF